jgi:hypothetical protein
MINRKEDERKLPRTTGQHLSEIRVPILPTDHRASQPLVSTAWSNTWGWVSQHVSTQNSLRVHFYFGCNYFVVVNLFLNNLLGHLWPILSGLEILSNRHTNFLMDFTLTNRETLKPKTTKEASHMITQHILHKYAVYVWNISTREGHNRLALSVSCRELIKRLRLYLWAPHITRAATRSCKSCNSLRTEKITYEGCETTPPNLQSEKTHTPSSVLTTWNRVLGKLIVAETVIKLLTTRNQNVHNCFHNSPSLYQLSQLNPVSHPFTLFL